MSRLTRPRKLAYAVTVWLVFFGLVEVILGLAGVEPLSSSLDPFAGFSKRHPVFRANVDEGVYRASKSKRAATFNREEFALEKPENGFRVFSLGGSSTYGWPWGADVAFPRLLRDGLQQVWPDRVVESLNVGGMSYASHRIRILVHEVLDYDLDLLIIYGGHNEFVETRFYRHLLSRNQSLDPFRELLYRSRLYSLLSQVLTAPETPDPEAEPASVGDMLGLEVRRDPLGRVTQDERALIVARYEENLRAIVDLATDRGVPVLISTVASNLAGWPPIQSALDGDVEEATRAAIETTLADFKERLARGDANQLESQLEDLVAVVPEHAGLHYSLGRVYESQRRFDEAHREFVLARDLDTMPARAPSIFNEVVRKVAAETDAFLVDAEATILDSAPDGLVGFDQIEDYVHPTPKGHWQIAAEIWNVLKRAGQLEESAPEFAIAAGPPLDRDQAMPDDPMLRARFFYNLALVFQQLGESERSAENYRECLRSNPSHVTCEFNLAVLRMNDGDLDASVEGFRKVVALEPNNPNWLYHLGYALLQRGQPKKAESWLQRSVSAAPGNARNWRALSRAYAVQGKKDDANRALQRARGLGQQRPGSQ